MSRRITGSARPIDLSILTLNLETDQNAHSRWNQGCYYFLLTGISFIDACRPNQGMPDKSAAMNSAYLFGKITAAALPL
jgi:hypothetical protein